ncbi:uncharacterized protein B0I36DRAFT_363175 [Microdochium trichocladiopsis]|uniref:Uncharacterized protein n=1 Tax=Microdochium trichocladiopsis TaxID=1682393 RepID=A0A9P9BUJ1_9PEZI|nr:uncharacterized protein B0I36DRAFT_363175 [Microdochium trichocladiopsis]KAH7031489.1 hypothetical protein B0I36DRAFT_363175 [Microdochium trichocladiopsis]
MASPPPSSQLPPPPPASQSHFAKFDNFTPDDHAPFDDEFARLASSQQWVPGSQEYTKERTIAMREELKFSFFSLALPAAGGGDDELTPQQLLEGYQLLCDEVRIPRGESVPECKRALKATLVNIIDLLNVRRTGGAVEVWDNFDAFRTYTLADGQRIDKEEAKAAPGILASLLQNFGRGRNVWVLISP